MADFQRAWPRTHEPAPAASQPDGHVRLVARAPSALASHAPEPRAAADGQARAPYVYPQVDELQGTNKVGSRQCVALLQHYAGLPLTARWRAGVAVVGNRAIAKGTAIATFVDGRYRNLRSGNHAAFYLSQDAGGIWVMDQWANDQTKPKVSKRYIRRKGKSADGRYVDPSNNADAYSVISR